MRIDVVYAASPEIEPKLATKHHVDMQEVAEVLTRRPIVRAVGRDQYGEMRYSGLGQTDDGRYLSVVFVHQLPNRAKVITARPMSDNERHYYRQRREP